MNFVGEYIRKKRISKKIDLDTVCNELKISKYVIHKIENDNLILGDFNFIDNDIDKGKYMDNRDKLIKPHWEEFKSKCAVIRSLSTAFSF